MMRTRLKLNPGQRGTKQLVEQYGDQLVCVRYRYDETCMRRYKTVELIIDESDWEPRKRKTKEVISEKGPASTDVEQLAEPANQPDLLQRFAKTITSRLNGQTKGEATNV